MSSQLELPGFEPALPASDRLFLALRPPRDVAGQLHALASRWQAEEGWRGRAVEVNRLHVTLAVLVDCVGGLPPDWVARASEAVQGVRLAPFPIAFDRLVSHWGRARGPRPVVLLAAGESPGVHALHRQLQGSLLRLGLPLKGHGFQPHVTLYYVRHPVRERPLAPIGWVAHDLVLIHSLLGRHVHRTLGRWSLQGEPLPPEG